MGAGEGRRSCEKEGESVGQTWTDKTFHSTSGLSSGGAIAILPNKSGASSERK
jgi:hypothetical protein